jgi:hypothetical protein
MGALHSPLGTGHLVEVFGRIGKFLFAVETGLWTEVTHGLMAFYMLALNELMAMQTFGQLGRTK